VGGRAPAYAVATGKAMLAWQDESSLQLLPETFERTTSRTLAGRKALLVETAQVRELGYAINRGEWREGVCGAAAVILDAQRQVIAAVGVSGPAERLRPAALRKHAERVVEAAREVSRAMGCTRYEPIPAAADRAAA
jgi:DNA-binding IclR family transcriptional regulator